MKNHILLIPLLSVILWSCATQNSIAIADKKEVKANLDLVNVINDKVKVTVKPAFVNTTSITYQLPKIIPGTYAIQDYGRYIDEFKAYAQSGQLLAVSKKDINTWEITNAQQLDHVEYWVNDTFDSEVNQASKNENIIFSPAGTNILKGENFFLNLSGFIGYFGGQKDNPYVLTIDHPEDLTGTTALIDIDKNTGKDVFNISRYAEAVDSPIMYAKPDISTFKIGDMEVYLHVYSPRNKKITSATILPHLKEVMTAQKEYMGKINKTKKYAVLAYLSSLGADDAQGLGALEHNTSTSATFDDNMEPDGLNHTISHEFFHTLTPLNVHSKEIHYFDFNQPKMSQHLWMYEGFTEYFASLFKVNKKIEDEASLYKILTDKYYFSKSFYDDDMSFTEMSKNVVNPEINKQFGNVYNKGTLMAMCLDLIIREKSSGKRSLLSVMGELSDIYGPERPFDDDALIPEFTKITYPEIGEFIQKYIVKGMPLDYNQYFGKVGIKIQEIKQPVKIAFAVNDKKYFKVDPKTNKGYIQTLDGNNVFLKAIGFEDQDEIIEFKGYKLEGPNLEKLITIMGLGLVEGDDFSAKVIRNGKLVELKGKVKLNYVDGNKIDFVDPSKLTQKNQWLYE